MFQVYIEDAIGDRVWVDLEPCKKLVDNICVTFQTKLPSGQTSEGSSSTSRPGTESSSSSGSSSGGSGGGMGMGSGVGVAGGVAEKEEAGGLSLDCVEVKSRWVWLECHNMYCCMYALVY